MIADLVRQLLALLRSGLRFVWRWVLDLARENPYLAFAAVYGIARATGVTVQTGNTGLLFSFGRAKREIPPGFRLLIPFLQVVRILPTRSRTLDLPRQKVTTFDGLVFFVDANLVYRIVDVRKALIQIDDLDNGMIQMLGLSVQEVLRESQRQSFRVSSALDAQLTEAMAWRLAPWGVEVEHAGFTSVKPSPETLRLTQLERLVTERRRGLELFEGGHLPRRNALALLGSRYRVVPHTRLSRNRETLGRRRARVRKLVRRATAEAEVTDLRRRKLFERLARVELGLSERTGESARTQGAAARKREARKQEAKGEAPRAEAGSSGSAAAGS